MTSVSSNFNLSYIQRLVLWSKMKQFSSFHQSCSKLLTACSKLLSTTGNKLCGVRTQLTNGIWTNLLHLVCRSVATCAFDNTVFFVHQASSLITRFDEHGHAEKFKVGVIYQKAQQVFDIKSSSILPSVCGLYWWSGSGKRKWKEIKTYVYVLAIIRFQDSDCLVKIPRA
jgi:hypothetical protein